jgi:DNA-binding transcriptional ArsR family regulator
MNSKVRIEYSPIYEFLLSLNIFVKPGMVRYLNNGDWIKKAENLISDDLKNLIRQYNDFRNMITFTNLLVLQSPNQNSIQDFIHEVEALSPGELFEKLSNFVCDPLNPDLGKSKEQFVHILKLWYEEFWTIFHHSEESTLQADVLMKKQQLMSMDPILVIEKATLGLSFEKDQDYSFILIPSIYLSPLSIIYKLNHLCMIFYPVDSVSNVGEVPIKLKHLLKTLSDENRLKILRFIAQKPRSYTEVLNFIGLSKSTVFQHLLLLRTSGLLRLDVKDDIYEINKDHFSNVQALLNGYIFK